MIHLYLSHSLGLVYGPYGSIGAFKRVCEKKAAACFSWSRLFKRLFGQ